MTKPNCEEEIKAFSQRAVQVFTNVFDHVKVHPPFDILYKDLLFDGLNHDVFKVGPFTQLFNQLYEIKGPVLYWFEITADINNQNIIDALFEYKKQPGFRAVPAFKKTKETTCLYVGKVKRSFFGRIMQHMGYYKQASTGALQLHHWIGDIPLNIKVHVYEFLPEMANFMIPVENHLASVLKPLIGTHK